MPQSKNIQEITALRLFFMLMIFIHHCNFNYGGGGCAVSGFFMISGFCMTLGYGTKVLNESFSWKNFMLKRAIKLYPIHWICLLLTWVLSWHFHFGPRFFATLGVNAALLQSWIPQKWMYFSFNSPSWYLCDILFFAAAFPFLMRFISRLTTNGKLLILGVLVGMVVIISILIPTELRHAWLYVNPIARIVDCCIGMYLALAYLYIKQNDFLLGRCSHHVEIIDFILVLLFVLVVVQSITKFGSGLLYQTSFWIPNALLLCIVVLRSSIEKVSIISKILKSRIVTYLGECSLSFYLLHSVVMKGMGLYNNSFSVNAKSVMGGGVVLFVTFIVSRLSYNLIEKKMTTYLNTRFII